MSRCKDDLRQPAATMWGGPESSQGHSRLSLQSTRTREKTCRLLIFFIAGNIHQGSERFKRKAMLFHEFFSATACAHSLAAVFQWRLQRNDRVLE